jgi:hypothetical protein
MIQILLQHHSLPTVLFLHGATIQLWSWVCIHYSPQFGFLINLRHTVGLPGRVISSSQGLKLHRTAQHTETKDKHPCPKRGSNTRSGVQKARGPRVRPLDQLLKKCVLLDLLICFE